MRVHRLRVARRAKGTPREAIRILQRARDVAQLSAAAATDLAHVRLRQNFMRAAPSREGPEQVARVSTMGRLSRVARR
jgi:Holliday junction resolvasome RuvABC ATP-dependent DNA helicase subunit